MVQDEDICWPDLSLITSNFNVYSSIMFICYALDILLVFWSLYFLNTAHIFSVGDILPLSPCQKLSAI